MEKNSYFNENTLEDLLEEMKQVYISDRRPWIIGYSGGKDSTTVVELVYKMLQSLTPFDPRKMVYVVSSDTMVENPLIKTYLSKMSNMIGEAAGKEGLPLETRIVKPLPNNTFWTNVIGRGFPTPNLTGKFRWCTDRLKIRPSSEFIKEIISSQKTEVVVLLGVRKAESIVRKRRIEGRELANRLLNRHEVIKEAYVYNPIVDLTTEDVWDILMKYDGGRTPWGTDNNELIQLYSGADGGECPFAWTNNKGEQTQSCGQSRFGCWVCTVVKEDKSLNGFIKTGHRELIPLAEFRKWLISIRNMEQYREKKRRDGTVYHLKSGEIGYGPFTWEARQMILERLLRLQKQIGYELITEEELRAIDEIWDQELDLSRRTLVELYYRVTGEKLPWHDYKKPLIDEESQKILEDLSGEEEVPYELVRDLILTADNTRNESDTKTRREALEKVLSRQWLHYDVLKEISDED